MRSTSTTPRIRERGGAAVILLLLLSSVAAMLGVVAIRGAFIDLRLAGAQRAAKSGFFCAEAGLDAGRAWFAARSTLWNQIFDTAQSPPSGYPVTGDIDGDGAADYSVTLVDNVDEFPPAIVDPKRDNDRTAIMVSRCTNPTMGPHLLQQIIVLNGRGTNYRSQAGMGVGHTGNAN